MEQPVPLPLPPVAAGETASLASNASSWYNLTAWTVNVTRYAPSLEDLVWAGPRMVKKLGSYMTLAEQDGTAATGIFDSSSPSIFNAMTSTATDGTGAAQGAASQTSRFALTMEKTAGLASVFNYVSSRWALSCIAMAVILNRTHIFAATRRKLRLHWQLRLALRVLPAVLLVLQVRRLLMAIQCQTSADFSDLRWGNASMSSDFMFAYPNSFLNSLSSTLLFGATDEQSCTTIRMIPSDLTDGSKQLRGSLSGLWPLFTTYCLSHFVETISCAVQGRPLSAETGMTLFEQSLAFAEADATIISQLGSLKLSNSRPSESSGGSSSGTVTTLTRSMVLQRVNTSPEVLLMALLSSMTHLSSHVLGVFDLQAKYRLVNTGFWGLCFMGSIVWSVFNFEADDPTTHAILRFPTVCIIGFVPHLMVLAGILLCLLIYGLALLLSALSPPENQERSLMTFRQRIMYAHENMQANVSLAEVRVTRDMDFYTALLRTGFAAITMASEAVYLNEDRGVSLLRHTWLEESRYREAEEIQRQWVAIGPSGARYDQVGAIGLIPVKDGPTVAPNGFARERAAQEVLKFRGGKPSRAGIGATERSSRWLMATEFFMGVARLVLRIWATVVIGILKVFRIRRQPAWLVWLAQRPKYTDDDNGQSQSRLRRPRQRRRLFLNRNTAEPRSEGMDVEEEFRRVGRDQSEEKLDKDLYHYFLEGGWWGSGDGSGDYEPDASEDDWDATSVITTTTAADETDNETGDDSDNGWESEDPGQRTPTQTTPRMSREGTPVADSPMGMADLARLLRPANNEERDEAATLAAHLVNPGIMTRAGYRRLEQQRRTRVLGSPIRPGPFAPGALRSPERPLRLEPEEEENLLEQILLSKRQEAAAAAAGVAPTTPTPGSTSRNAIGQASQSAGFGDGADADQPPQCVVCQCMPRTVIVWPCRCLSLCDDCRVSLAMNNFDKCVCCRREVLSFSRIYTP